MSRIDPDRIPLLDDVVEPGEPAAIELGRRIRETLLAETALEPGPTVTASISRGELEAIVDRHLDALRQELLEALEVWLDEGAAPR